ncbi:MAG: ATP-dependent helicase [Bacillota bacterium]
MGKQHISDQDSDPRAEKWLARLRRELNPAQFQFATAVEPVILGLAGPGSGKTRALVYRTAHLIESGIPPERVLLLTFTNKAAEEMKDRLKSLLGFWPQELWAGTFHSIGARILRRHALLVERNSSFTILDDDDNRQLLKQLVNSLSRSLGEEERSLLLKRGLLARVISQARNSDLTVKEVLAESYPFRLEYLELVQNLAEMYAQKKRESNALDFDDLLLCWLDLFQQHPAVREKYRQRFEHVLVDEFQDTNVIQARLVDQFAGYSSLCVVGDDAQSIYAFRFAHVGNILSFPEKYPHCLVVRMEQNYRSTPQIVALANHSINCNHEQLRKQLFSKNPAGEKPWIVGARNASREASFVAQRIRELNREHGVPLGEIAVLYRSGYLSPEVEFELVRRGFPYRTFGGVRFLQKAHIKDVLAYLKILYNPADESAWRRVATLQSGLGPASFETLWAELKLHGNPLDAALSGRVAPARGKAGWEALCRTLQTLQLQSDSGVARLIAAVSEGNYEQILKKNYPDQFEERLRGIERLAMYGDRFESLNKFLESLALEESLFADAADAGPEGEFVTLSTIHSAKGKEWDAVFVIGLNEGHFPSRRGDERDLPEERRLFYVAATRARRYLYLSTYWEDYRNYGSVSGGPSLFLKELPQDCFEPVFLEEYE